VNIHDDPERYHEYLARHKIPWFYDNEREPDPLRVEAAYDAHLVWAANPCGECECTDPIGYLSNATDWCYCDCHGPIRRHEHGLNDLENEMFLRRIMPWRESAGGTMGLTGRVPLHPAEYSPAVLEVIRTLLRPGERVHDPFAGRGIRLGALCDELGCTFSGTDIEPWEDRDERVRVGDAMVAAHYPPHDVVVTSPVYFGNRISSDYVGGPTPTTKRAGRRSYGISRGAALSPRNIARACRPGDEDSYIALHGFAVAHWGPWAVVNIDLPISEMWQAILKAHHYEIDVVLPAYTRRLRGITGSDKRAEHEVVIVAAKPEAR
jgi:hypothetical protein